MTREGMINNGFFHAPYVCCEKDVANTESFGQVYQPQGKAYSVLHVITFVLYHLLCGVSSFDFSF